MAKVWFCYEGDRPTWGDAKAELPLAKAVELLRLEKDRHLGNDPKNVRFGEPGHRLNLIRGYEHVVVEIEEEEARGSGWKSGYYHSPIRPDEASKKLGL
jgi:hypothetical protein